MGGAMVIGASGDVAVAALWALAVGVVAALVGAASLAGTAAAERRPHGGLVTAGAVVLLAIAAVEIWVGASSSLFDRHELLSLSGVLAVALSTVLALLVWRGRRAGRSARSQLLVGLAAGAAICAWLTWLVVPFHLRVRTSVDDMTADARRLQGSNATAEHHQIGTFETVAVEPSWFCRDGLGFVLDPSGAGSALWWCPKGGIRRSVAPPHLQPLGDGWYLEREAGA